jgi:hypothetical protein
MTWSIDASAGKSANRSIPKICGGELGLTGWLWIFENPLLFVFFC